MGSLALLFLICFKSRCPFLYSRHFLKCVEDADYKRTRSITWITPLVANISPEILQKKRDLEKKTYIDIIVALFCHCHIGM